MHIAGTSLQRVGVAVVVVLLVVIVGGTVRSALARRAARPDPGVLSGAIVLRGGPPPAPGYARPPLAGTVSIYTPAGRLVRRSHVSAGHRFRFVLAPGPYLLNVGKTLRYKFPYGCPPASAQVRRDTTTTVIVGTGCGVP